MRNFTDPFPIPEELVRILSALVPEHVPEIVFLIWCERREEAGKGDVPLIRLNWQGYFLRGLLPCRGLLHGSLQRSAP